MKILDHADLGQTELRNAVVANLSSAPSSPKAGQKYYNTASNVSFYWNGTTWRPEDAAALTDGSVPIAALATNPLARANHTGTQLASTISNLQATVNTYTLDTFAAPVTTVGFNSQRLTGLATGTSASDAVNLSQMQSYVTASVAGQTAIKNPARAYAASNITLSGTQTIDGISLAAGDRVLAGAQSTASQNGLYVVASGAWSLAADGNAASEWLEGTEILIAEGSTYGGSIFRQATSGPTLTTLTFVQTSKVNTYTADGTTLLLTGQQFSVNYGAGLTVSGGKLVADTTVVTRKYAATVTGDGSTTNFTVTHNLGTTDVGVTMRDSTGAHVYMADVAASTSTVTLAFPTAPASGTTYRVIVTG